MPEDIDLQEKLNDLVCNIKFITILDNSGKIIYGKYFTIKEREKQIELEKQLCFQAKNLNIIPDEIDIFNMDDYNILVKIIGEIAYFVGINEEDNECLAYNFCKIFENILGTITNENFSRTKIFENYEKLVVMIDEMLDEGLIVNSDPESIEKLIHQEENGSKFISFNNNDSSPSSGGGLFSSIFGGAKSLFG